LAATRWRSLFDGQHIWTANHGSSKTLPSCERVMVQTCKPTTWQQKAYGVTVDGTSIWVANDGL